MIETKFKQTEIGLIPEDWEVKTLGELSYVTSGGTPSTENSSYWGGDIPWMNSGELNLKQVNAVEGRITELGLKQSSTRMIPPYCVLIGLAGQGKTRGTAAYNTIPLCINQSIGAVLPNNSYNTMYMYYYIDSQYQNLRTLSSGDGGRGGLTKQLLSDFSVPLPPLDEQEKIAEALSDVDGLISDLDALIAKKRDIKQGVIQQLVSGAKRLDKFDGPWRECKLGEALNYEQPTAYIVSDTEYIEHGIPVLTAGKSFVLGYTAEKIGIYDKGDVIIFDDFTTDSKYVSFPFKAKSSAMKMLTANEGYDLRFMYELLSMIDYKPSDHMRHWIGMFSKLSVSIPSYEEQVAISKILKSMDDDIATLEEKKTKYEAIKQGMMQELLTGKIRLV